MKKILILCFFLMTSFFSFSQIIIPRTLAYNPQFPEEVLISASELSFLINKWYHIEAYFEDLKVEKFNKKYFLLAKETEADKVYAFRLRKMDGNYHLFILNIVNICDCGRIDLNEFKLEKNKIVGCKSGGLSTAGAY